MYFCQYPNTKPDKTYSSLYTENTTPAHIQTTCMLWYVGMMCGMLSCMPYAVLYAVRCLVYSVYSVYFGILCCMLLYADVCCCMLCILVWKWTGGGRFVVQLFFAVCCVSWSVCYCMLLYPEYQSIQDQHTDQHTVPYSFCYKRYW
jgi:hypothetical protein